MRSTVYGCCTRTYIAREHLEDTLRICDVSAMGLLGVWNGKHLQCTINLSYFLTSKSVMWQQSRWTTYCIVLNESQKYSTVIIIQYNMHSIKWQNNYSVHKYILSIGLIFTCTEWRKSLPYQKNTWKENYIKTTLSISGLNLFKKSFKKS